MKMTEEHYQYIKEALKPYITRKTQKTYADADLSQMRYLFDCLHAAKLTQWICQNLYSYISDNHIFTALKRAEHELI